MTNRQQDLAEQQFKNIQSFKGQKASDIIPAMQFMSASLGVSCDFCHTDDRASDEKKTKLAARKMIAMQKAINDQNFEGRMRVTCASCHNGHTHPSAVPPVLGSDLRPERSEEVKPDAVLAAYSKAVGADQLPEGSSLVMEGHGTAFTKETPIAAKFSGSKSWFDTKGADRSQQQGFNGTVAWFTTPKGVQQVPYQYAESFVLEKKIYAGAATLPKLTETRGATAKIDGKDMLVVSGTIEGEKTRATFYFDKQTGLLTRTLFSYPSILGNIVQTNDYMNYRRIGGIEVPMDIVNHSTEGDDSMHFRSGHLEKKTDPAEFEPPKS